MNKIIGYTSFISQCMDYPFEKVEWLIPNELAVNKIVMDKMKFSAFREIDKIISDIENYSHILSGKYLDIEKIPIINKIDELKKTAYEMIDKINENLSHYHWEWVHDIKNGYRIGLFGKEPFYIDGSRIKDRIYKM